MWIIIITSLPTGTGKFPVLSLYCWCLTISLATNQALRQAEHSDSIIFLDCVFEAVMMRKLCISKQAWSRYNTSCTSGTKVEHAFHHTLFLIRVWTRDYVPARVNNKEGKRLSNTLYTPCSKCSASYRLAHVTNSVLPKSWICPNIRISEHENCLISICKWSILGFFSHLLP